MIRLFMAEGRRARVRLPMPRAWIRKAAVAMAFGAAVLICAMGADAAPIPWRDAPIAYVANGKPLKQVLKDLFTTQPFPLVIHGEVKGTVNGRFDKPASRVFQDLEAAYGFVWYFDGAALHVSPSDDLRSDIIPVASLGEAQVIAMLQRLGLSEPRFPVRIAGGSAFVTGPKAYVDLVAKALAVERERGAAPVPAARGGATRAAASPGRKLRIFQLKHAQAWDVKRSIGDREYVIPGIATILRRLAGGGVEAGDRVDAGDIDSSGGDRQRLPGVLGVAAAAAPAGVASERAYIDADVRTNSVIVRDSAENLGYYAEIVEKLDRPQRLVELEVTIVDISSSAARDLGAELAARSPGFGRGVSAVSAGGDGFAFQGVVGGPGGQLRLRIAALEQQGQAKVVSQPKILTLDNIEAVLGNESTAYARVAGAYQTDLYPLTAGLLMKITPQVVEGRKGPRVRLFVDIRDGKLDRGTEVDGLPTTSRNVIATQAVVGDGQVFLVGGHRRETSSSETRGVPGLSKAPVIGGLFRRKGNRNELAERLLMITPRIVADDEDEAAGEDATPVADVPPAKVAAGGRTTAGAAQPSRVSRPDAQTIARPAAVSSNMAVNGPSLPRASIWHGFHQEVH